LGIVEPSTTTAGGDLKGPDKHEPANIVIVLFHFRGLLLVWGMTISKSLDHHLQRRKVTGA